MSVHTPQRYRKKADCTVQAIQLKLEGLTFSYRKWGAEQRSKSGDWLVDNDGDVYTVDGAVFARTYRRQGPGLYLKTTHVWAQAVAVAGQIQTKEGISHYQAGDYLVSNHPDGSDAYCMPAAQFQAQYVLDE